MISLGSLISCYCPHFLFDPLLSCQPCFNFYFLLICPLSSHLPFPFIQLIMLSLHDYSFNHYLTVLKGLPQAGTIVFSLNVSGEFAISSVLSCHSKNLKRWMGQCYCSVLWDKQRKIHPQGWGAGWPKREEKRGLNLCWLPPFICFFSFPWACTMLIRLARRVVGFTWGSHSGPGPSFVLFSWAFSFLCLLATIILDSFFLY